MDDNLESYKHIAPDVVIVPECVVWTQYRFQIGAAYSIGDGAFQICVYDQLGIEQKPCTKSVIVHIGGHPASLSIEDGKLIAR